MIQKTELIERILESLRKELTVIKEGARESYEVATHEESQPENRFDTHSLEASYLAAGQAKVVVEIEDAVMRCQNMELNAFEPDDPIGVGALVKLKSKRETTFYFLVPIAGGIEVKDGRKTILVITPQSPIGKLLVGHKAGEVVHLETTTLPKKFEIVSVK
ncbi:MAG: transcription elongation factor GreAB [Verrucomicrobia bacterium]|nr:MAG: transcription elongation factor GreAB [Verrucomicrobiota bacterium]